MKRTRDYADVIRAEMAADPELAAAIEEEQRIADREQAEYDAAHPWVPCAERLPEAGVVVETKIDDVTGVRNVQRLKLYRRSPAVQPLWFLSDGSMYVYYEPTHWRSIGE